MAITGVDVMSDYRTMYEDKQSGIDLLRKLGGFVPAVCNRLDQYFENCHPRKAGPGDVFIWQCDHLKCLGFIWDNGNALVANKDRGWSKVNKDHILVAWRIN